ncbi:MAG: alpha/beta hydrolase [Myxococcales bacterium]|nr:alpha/beta hydrolase [Myxococcales bacterium]
MGVMRAVLMGLFLGCSPAWAGTVSLDTPDDVRLTAQSWGRSGDGVLLLHAEGRDRQDWATLAPRLAANGFRVLALDLRGHGESRLAGSLEDEDFVRMSADVVAGIRWLEARGAARVHLVGAALGANLALHTAANDPLDGSMVLLSPQLNAHGMKVSAEVPKLRDTSVLVVASQEDTLSARAAAYLAERAPVPTHLQLYQGAGVGARMLNGAPDLESLVLSWLNGTFLSSRDPTAAQQAAVKSGDLQSIEATGTKLEDRKR